jgi:GTP-binding protein
LELKYRQHIKARHGGHGEGSNRTGRGSDDVEIVVPVGTLITDRETGEILADLNEDGQRAFVARGGIGGKGNAHFATSTHQTPRFAQDGMPGEERWIHLELKLLADVGLVGLPNAGKSTFLSRVSAARPKIADYPFTTLVPQLGVVSFGDRPGFVLADIPGLIEGAHAGAGMGIQFLRHIERTGLLLHLLDISGHDDDESPWRQYETINEELRLFNPELGNKPQLVAIGKIDLPDTRARLGKRLPCSNKKAWMCLPFHRFQAKACRPSSGISCRCSMMPGVAKGPKHQRSRSCNHERNEETDPRPCEDGLDQNRQRGPDGRKRFGPRDHRAARG